MRCPPVGIHKENSGETFRGELDAICLTGETRASSITTARTIMGGRRVKQPMNFTERRFTSTERRFTESQPRERREPFQNIRRRNLHPNVAGRFLQFLQKVALRVSKTPPKSKR